MTVQVITVAVGLSELDVELARQISRAASDLGVPANPSAVQHVELAFDVVDRPTVMGFWKAALGYVAVGPDVMVEPNLIGPPVSFHGKEYVAPRNRVHVDVATWQGHDWS